MENRQVVRGVRTGGRSARVRQAILDATLHELVATGYATLNVDAVASTAGVNKTTVYRRWAGIDDLLVDALAEWSDDNVPIPDTGSIDTDLPLLGKALADQLNDGLGRELAAALLTAGGRSSELRDAIRRFFDHQCVRAGPLFTAAVERGELPVDVDVDAALTTFRAPLFYRIVTTGDHIDQALIARAAHITVAAARAGALSA